MPIYVYRNLTTGETFEVEQRMVDAALTSDPTTGDPVKRLIQPVGIAFKGSGFYVTDSRGSNGKRPAAASAPDGAAKGDAPAAEGASKSGGDASDTSARSDVKPTPPPPKPASTGATSASRASAAD